jgi:hypothetical protein
MHDCAVILELPIMKLTFAILLNKAPIAKFQYKYQQPLASADY